MYLTHFQIILLAGVPLTILLTAFLIMIKLASERDDAVIRAGLLRDQVNDREKLVCRAIEKLQVQGSPGARGAAEALTDDLLQRWGTR